MTLRRFAWRELTWGGAAVVLASAGLVACDDGGGGGCPELGGSWQIQTTCEGGPTSCQVDQDGCSITLECDNGQTLTGTASKSSVTFKDDEVSCSGDLEGLEDDDENGFIMPEIDGECRPMGGDACDVAALCNSGDCTVPEDEDNGNDEGDSGEGGSSGQGGSSGFLGGGNGGNGGVSGDGPAGEGGVSGAGTGGVSGAGTGGVAGLPAGNGGVGGSVSGDCESCVGSSCSGEASSCTAGSGCQAAADCAFNSGCYFDDGACLDSFCGGVPEPTSEGVTALMDLIACTATNCADSCPVFSDGPVAGTGGVGGGSGEGGVGGTPPGPGGCSDTCTFFDDGECDDGGPGMVTAACEYGTDCTDCGPREPGGSGF